MDSIVTDALTYLGVRDNADAATVQLVLDSITLLENAVTPRHTLKNYRREEAAPFLAGEDVVRFLDDAPYVTLFAATLGIAADILIKKQQATDMAMAAVTDACASAMLEHYADTVDLSYKSLFPTMRFSPGYGDYPIAMQPMIVRALRGEKIGITVLESHMLAPSKSITAVVGLTETPRCTVDKCKTCSKTDCTYRR